MDENGKPRNNGGKMEIGTNPVQHASLRELELSHSILKKVIAGSYLDFDTNNICIDGWTRISDAELEHIRKLLIDQA